jgi:phage FluMu protein Com
MSFDIEKSYEMVYSYENSVEEKSVKESIFEEISFIKSKMKIRKQATEKHLVAPCKKLIEEQGPPTVQHDILPHCPDSPSVLHEHATEPQTPVSQTQTSISYAISCATSCTSEPAPKSRNPPKKSLVGKKSKKISKVAHVPATELTCEYCNKVFTKAQAMGGHISKKHPGVSKIYKKKMVTRENRAPERALLQESKEILLEYDPEFDFKNNRKILNSLKKQLKTGTKSY